METPSTNWRHYATAFVTTNRVETIDVLKNVPGREYVSALKAHEFFSSSRAGEAIRIRRVPSEVRMKEPPELFRKHVWRCTSMDWRESLSERLQLSRAYLFRKAGEMVDWTQSRFRDESARINCGEIGREVACCCSSSYAIWVFHMRPRRSASLSAYGTPALLQMAFVIGEQRTLNRPFFR